MVQIGQVGQPDVGQVTSLIEPPTRAVERLKLRPFRDGVLASIEIRTSDDEPRARLYRDSMQVRQLPNTDLIELKVRGYSPEEARKLAEATISRLQEIHGRLALPSIERLRSQLDTITRELKRAQAERETLLSNTQLRQEIGPGNRFAENVLLGNILATRDAEIRDLQQRRLTLEERLTPSRTYPTSLVEEIFVPERPASPRLVLTVSLAIAGGLAAGMLIALVFQDPRRNLDSTRSAG